MKVFVAGATGAIGRQLVPMLVQRGHEVVGMTRTEFKRTLLASLGARPVVADALDPEAVGSHPHHARGAPSRRAGRCRRGLDGGRGAPLRRLVRSRDLVRCEAPRRARRADPQAHVPDLAGTGAGMWSFIHIEDAATATADAVERGAPGIYHVIDDDPAPLREWLPVAAGALGAKRPRRLPRWLVRLAVGEAAAVLLTEARGASNAKAKRELGWRPRYPSWRQGFVKGLD